MSRDANQYIRTFTGRKFWPLDPRESDVCIEDIAHALSNNCRWGGHCRHFYSIASHSVFVYTRLWALSYVTGSPDPKTQLCGLLHDAAEAYLLDMPRPIKRQMPEYSRIEENLMHCIARRFDFPWPKPAVVDEIDNLALYYERKVLFPERCSDPKTDLSCDISNYDLISSATAQEIRRIAPEQAEQTFLAMFERATEACRILSARC